MFCGSNNNIQRKKKGEETDRRNSVDCNLIMQCNNLFCGPNNNILSKWAVETVRRKSAYFYLLSMEYFMDGRNNLVNWVFMPYFACCLYLLVCFSLSDPNSNPDVLSLSLQIIFSYFYLNWILNVVLKTYFLERNLFYLSWPNLLEPVLIWPYRTLSYRLEQRLILYFLDQKSLINLLLEEW